MNTVTVSAAISRAPAECPGSRCRTRRRALARGFPPRRARRSVIIAMHLRPFQQLAVVAKRLEMALRDEAVMDAVDLAGPPRPRRHGNGQREIQADPAAACGSASSFPRPRARKGSTLCRDGRSGRGHGAFRLDQRLKIAAGARQEPLTSAAPPALLAYSIFALVRAIARPRLEVETDGGQRGVVGFGAQRIGFAGKFLREEVQPPPIGPPLESSRARSPHGRLTVQFFADVGPDASKHAS